MFIDTGTAALWAFTMYLSIVTFVLVLLTFRRVRRNDVRARSDEYRRGFNAGYSDGYAEAERTRLWNEAQQ